MWNIAGTQIYSLGFFSPKKSVYRNLGVFHVLEIHSEMHKICGSSQGTQKLKTSLLSML